ncbi:lanthionine synthetase LanC family protein [Flavobacterium collinsii]|uniref:Lanthionine synthetase-like protein n=1 Tax=Flavobacterium collinsii TaxID=1114861 RepID=A0A9W4X4N1_9FLAO|nr:lanthionine synthetase LanC family protein [Flavobacterium collinsii]CAI2768650.1 Lanthionine synthetase-like protein [Flavobacterium collinsii]
MNGSILKIEKAIWESAMTDNRIGLMNGLSGVAMFYDNIYKAYGKEEYRNKLLSIVDRINSLLSENETSSNLCTGIAGYGLMLLRLQDKSIEIDEEYFEGIDLILQEDLYGSSEQNDYDYLHGSMGIAMYFIERHRTSKNDLIVEILDKFSKELIYKINYSFENVLVEPVFGDKQCYYFGLAHGVSGYLNFLVYLKKYFPEMDQDIRESLDIAITFLRNHKNRNINDVQYYPNLLILGINEFVKPIVAWCQGDLGISNALYTSGAYLNNDSLIKEAFQLVNNISTISLEDSGIGDFGMCHGCIGIIVQYHLASINLNHDYSEEINKWYKILERKTLNFENLKYSNNDVVLTEINLLDGLAGLGLGLLTVDKKIDTNWLQLFNLH